ncbi:MAG: hypothetical protein R3213_05280, partial [Flavobacteriaceae bacterium]|nr:hypothetical protein [Flavobacteriaceae bacterium]
MKHIIILVLVVLFTSCATYKPQSSIPEKSTFSNKEITHSFYIAGGTGTDDINSKVLDLFKEELKNAPEESNLLFTGDYTFKDATESENFELLKTHLELKNLFKGHTVFIPGHHEWHSKNAKEIEWVENYIKDNDLKDVEVEPNSVCPLEYRVLNDQLDILYVDTNWFMQDWDDIEGINKKCTDINTKRRFVEELEGYIKDSRGKNLVIVMHHPIFSNGEYAGYQTFGQSITPLPILGSFWNELNSLGGFNTQDMSSFRYSYMQMIISALAQENERVTIVSGHEKSLQLLKGGHIWQIISGAMGDVTGTKLNEGTLTNVGGSLDYEGKFAYGENGFAVLNYFKDGSSEVKFITPEKEFVFEVTPPFPPAEPEFPVPQFDSPTKTVAVTQQEDKLNKSGFYKWLWGERYRKYFGVPVEAKIAVLDTLYGGLKVTQQGGGHQSFSARLADSEGREFALRGLEKDALKFLKFKVKGIAYDPESYRGTFGERVIYDFFTSTHPFIQVVINPLAKEAGINHANTELFYVPKQPGFRLLGEDYGDQLYYIEQRPNDEQRDYPGYRRALPPEGGEITEFESTTDVLEKLNEDEKYSIDQREYIKARIFDMLIGDWDRHEDQWRWAQYEIGEDDIRFIPVPRDRDAAFSKFDGIAIPIIQMIMPDLRHWQAYGPNIENVKWFNSEGNNLDRALLNKHDTSVWVEEAQKIQNGLTDAEIDAAFDELPEEVQDEASEAIKNNLKKRLSNIVDIARRYGEIMQEKVVIHGTHKDDKIIVTRMPQGKTKVVLRRILSGEKNKIFFERTFDSEETDEIWIYGLNDKDEFKVEGKGHNEIMVRLIGGFGKDEFKISNTKKLKVYDWKYEEIEFKDKVPSKQLTNLYQTNTFFWRNFRENRNVIFPSLGFRQDDGLYLGAYDLYTNMGFNGEDFRYKHYFLANYYFNFQAVELQYLGAFANIFPNWQLDLGGYFTSNSFANNFFGFGNETTYDEDEVGRDFNRARMQQINFSAGISHRTLGIKGTFENIKVEDTEGRLFTEDNFPEEIFNNQSYLGGEVFLTYENVDAPEFPTRGLDIGLNLGYKTNLDLDNINFG